MAIRTFEDLLAPFNAKQFLADYRGQNWLHVEGAAARVSELLDWQTLSRLLNMEVWNHQTLLLVQDTQPVPPQAYCQQRVDRTGMRQLVPLPDRVEQHLARGASVVLNEVESLVPDVRAITDAITRALGAKVSANIYVSQQNHQAFDSHYDKTDVFVLQTLGSKRWRVYEGQIEAPVVHARFAGQPKEQITRLKGKVAREFVMQTGDLLYLPRGRFHDALATEGPSIHISIAVSEPKGLDYLQLVMDEAVGDPAFRQDLPLAEADLPAYFDQLAERLKEVAGAAQTKERGRRLRTHFAPPRPSFNLGKQSKKP